MAELRRYRARRDFAATPEPSGRAASPRRGALAYVVQRHAARRLHFDFRLELDGTLKSWAVPKEPGLEPGERRLAMHVEDHPLEYARFEGEIPAGQYGAGHVAIWDQGHWTPEGDPARAYRAGRLSFALEGGCLSGRWSLVRMRRSDDEKGDPWLLIRRSGGPSARRARAPSAKMPHFIPFQLATPGAEPPTGDEWLHELKLDGYRLACCIDHGESRLYTRNGHDWTDRFRRIAEATQALPISSAWLDGEAVVFEEGGLPHFGSLQTALQDGGDRISFVAFDCLWLDGRDLRGEPLEARKAILQRLLRKASRGLVALDHVEGHGERVLQEACRLGAEGIVSKRRDAPHEDRRARSWWKCRCDQRQEFVVGAYTPEVGHPRGLGALLLGTYDEEGRLVYAGRVGSGFDTAMRTRLLARLRSRRRRDSPFSPAVPRAEARGALYVDPEIVAEVRFKEWTTAGRLRQAVFLGLREDKGGRQVVRERPASGAPARRRTRSKTAVPSPRAASGERVAGVSISHPDRVLDAESGLTKLGLARYYAALWERIEPHLRDRALTVVRCPEGLAGECFFQKHAFPRAIRGVRPTERGGNPGLVVSSVEGLVGLVQNGVVELHVPAARASAPTRPDRIVLDLDPDPALPPDAVREEALRLHRLLQRLDLQCFVKSTGGRGLHVVVPFRTSARGADFAAVKRFTQGVGRALAATPGSLVVLGMAKAKRAGRIYFDDVRNRPGATAVAPYSVRARAGARVAFPLTWRALRTMEPPFSPSVDEVLRRLRRAAWPDLDAVDQALAPLPDA